jgi:hypothetical protein
MSGPENLEFEGSTFSVTLHLLSPRFQEWIRCTADRRQLRRLACACARATFALCRTVPPEALRAVELAERSCAGQVSADELDGCYARMSAVIRTAADNVQVVQRGAESNQASLEDLLAADLAHQAVLAARACVLRSAPVAAGETISEYIAVVRRRWTHETQSAFLKRADELLDSEASWGMGQQDELVRNSMRDLPRPFVVRLQKASDRSLRRFACACAADAVDAAGKEIAQAGESIDLDPLLRTIDVSRRHAEGQADAGALKAACEAAEKVARDWHQKANDLKHHREERPASSLAAACMAEAAACVQACAESSAKLAGVKCLRLALSGAPLIQSRSDSAAPLYPLLEQFLGPPPPE